jgi:geranylgeranyl pyrophosphate synthase
LGDLVGAPAEKLMVIAQAVERTHAAFLAHDDVIDESKMRRRRPTLRVMASNPQAILAGDLLLARVISDVANALDPLILKKLCSCVASTVEGEWLQLEARGRTDRTPEQLHQIFARKTGALLRWACEAPALLVWPETSANVQLAGRFGELLGIAYQYIDDAIDFSRHSEKPWATDLREGLLNSVTLEWMASSPEAPAWVSSALDDPKILDSPHPLPPGLPEAQSRIRLHAQGLLQIAESLLQELAQSCDSRKQDTLKSLHGMIRLVEGRTK